MRRRRALLSTTMLSGVVSGWLVGASSGALAGDLSTRYFKAAPAPVFEPAVDAVNYKLEGLGGSINGKSLYGAVGSVTIPLQGQYGAQIDGAAGGLDDTAFGSVAGHLFWRNPSQGLLGLYGSYTTWDRFGGINVGQVAAEFEYYYGRFTV